MRLFFFNGTPKKVWPNKDQMKETLDEGTEKGYRRNTNYLFEDAKPSISSIRQSLANLQGRNVAQDLFGPTPRAKR
jgi:hypothetical protein